MSLRRIALFEQVLDPTPAPDKCFIYAKDFEGRTEMFFMDQGGEITQITKDGYLNVTYEADVVGLPKQELDPAYSGAKGSLYSKKINGIVELFYRDSNGVITQLTNAGQFNIPDKIEEGNTKAEVRDLGADGYFYIVTEGTEKFRVAVDGTSTVRSGVVSDQWLSFSHDQTDGYVETGKGNLHLNPYTGIVEIGTATKKTGKLKLSGSTSGSVTIQPKNAAGTWALTLPDNDGSPNQVLQTDGDGVSSWATISTHDVVTLNSSAVTGGLSLSGQEISFRKATTSLDGYLCRADWATFNGKAPGGASFWTSTAESGLSAEVNIGALTTGLLKITVGGGIATPSTASAGSDYENPLTFQYSLTRSTNTVNLVNDSASPGNLYFYGTNGSGTKGWLAQSTLVPGAVGSDSQIQYNNGGAMGACAQLYWDDVSNLLGLNKSAPGYQFHIANTSTNGVAIECSSGTISHYPRVLLMRSSGGGWISNGTVIGQIDSLGYGSDGWTAGPYIQFRTSNDWDSQHGRGSTLALCTAIVETITIVHDGRVGIRNTSPGSNVLLAVGTAGTKRGVVSMSGGTAGTVTIWAYDSFTDWTWILPSSAGSSGQFLQTDGSGNTTWASSSGAPSSASFWTSTAESGLSAEVNIGALTTGLLKITVGGGTATPSTATAGSDYENPLTFQHSLTRSTNTVNLVGDSASPGSTYYYGTNSGGTKGWYALTAASPGGSDHQIQFNNGGAFGGAADLYWDHVNSRLSLGTITPGYAFVVKKADVPADVSLITYSTSSNYSSVLMSRYRGSFVSPAAVQTGDVLGLIQARGFTGTFSYDGSEINFFAAENWSESAQGSYVTFKTKVIGGTTAVERMRITGTGTLQVGFATGVTGQIDFVGTTSGKVSLKVADAAGTWTMKLPTTVGTSGYFLQTDGTGVTTWAAASASPGGSDHQIQFNNSSSFGGCAQLYWDHVNSYLGLGCSNPIVNFEISSDTASHSRISSFSDTVGNGSGFTFSRGRGTRAACTPVTSGTLLGVINFNGVYQNNDTDTITGVQIKGFADETWSGTGSGSYISFITTATASVTKTERMRITSAGVLQIGLATGATGKINFLGTTSGTVGLTVADAAGSWTMKLPDAAPAVTGYVLSATTGGVCSWVAQSGGHDAVTLNASAVTGGLSLSGQEISFRKATTSLDGYLCRADWATFNAKEPAVSKGDLTSGTASAISVSGGTGSVIGSGASISINKASASVDGYLGKDNWATFNSKADGTHYHTQVTQGNTQAYVKDTGTDGYFAVNTNGVERFRISDANIQTYSGPFLINAGYCYASNGMSTGGGYYCAGGGYLYQRSADGMQIVPLAGSDYGRSNVLLVPEGSIGQSFGKVVSVNPTFWVQSANGHLQPTESISFSHDQTDGYVETGKGNLHLNPKTGIVEIGTATKKTGKLKLSGSTSGSVTIQPKNAAGSWVLTLPDGDGDSGQVLQTDGNGVTSWAIANAGTVTVAETSAALCYLGLFTGSIAGNLANKTNELLTYNASSGQLCLGSSTSFIYNFDMKSNSTTSMGVFAYSSTAAFGPYLRLVRGSGNSVSPGAAGNAYDLGSIDFRGYYDSSNTRSGATISVTTTESFTTGAGSNISFKTCATGSTTLYERFKISNDGAISFPYVYNTNCGATNHVLYIDSTGKIGKAAAAYKTIIINAASAALGTTTPAVRETRELSSQKHVVDVLKFAVDGYHYANWSFQMPDDWTADPLTASISYFTTTTDTGKNAVMQLQASCSATDEAIDKSWGTTQKLTCPVSTTDNYLKIGTWSTAFTPSGTPVAGEQIFLRLFRDPTYSVDDTTLDIYVISLRLKYTITSSVS